MGPRARPAAAGDEPADRVPGRFLRLHRPSLEALRSAAADARVVTGRNLRHFIRQPQLLIFSTIQPIMFVFLFVYVFGGAVEGSLPPGVSYVDFLLPGIFVQSVAFRATQTAVGLSEDLERGSSTASAHADGTLGGARRPHRGRPRPQRPDHRADDGVGYIIGFSFQAGLLNALACVAVVTAFGSPSAGSSRSWR